MHRIETSGSLVFFLGQHGKKTNDGSSFGAATAVVSRLFRKKLLLSGRYGPSLSLSSGQKLARGLTCSEVRGEPLLCVESLRGGGGMAAATIFVLLATAAAGRAATVGLDDGASVDRVNADMTDGERVPGGGEREGRRKE